MIGKGSAERNLSIDEMREIVAQAAQSEQIDGKRVLVIIPDGTRTMPMPTMFSLFHESLGPRAKALDYLVALGTHRLMSDAELSQLVGQPVKNEMTGETRVFNHHWEDPNTFVSLGTIPAKEIQELTRGMMAQDVPVGLNKLILDYDQIFICGPVFPHEVAGFSGGTNIFSLESPGPRDHQFHALAGGADHQLRNYRHADTRRSRRVIDRAASMIPEAVSLLRSSSDAKALPVCISARRGNLEGRFTPFGAKTHRLRRAAVPARAFRYARDVSRPLDRRQGHVQNRARGGRWRRSRHLQLLT